MCRGVEGRDGHDVKNKRVGRFISLRMGVSGYHSKHRALFLVRTQHVACSATVCRYHEEV